jgi:hypothetical protein
MNCKDCGFPLQQMESSGGMFYYLHEKDDCVKYLLAKITELNEQTVQLKFEIEHLKKLILDTPMH